MKYTASICVSVYYRAGDCLELVLDSLIKEPLDHKAIQIFVCDDCCPTPQKTLEKLIDSYRDKFGDIQYFRHQERKGFRKTHLLQKSLELSEGNVFVTLDGDCVPTRGSVKALIKAAKTQKALCQGNRVFLKEESISWGLKNISNIEDYVILKTHFHLDNTKTRKNKKRYRDSLKAQRAGIPGRFNFSSGYLMGIQTRWLKQVGFVKTDIRGYFEDTDIAKKLYEDLGIDLFEVERSEVLHLFPHH